MAGLIIGVKNNGNLFHYKDIIFKDINYETL